MHVSSINHYALQVREGDLYRIIDLNAKTCTCRRFDLDQLPCVHATVACRICNTSLCNMCSQFYTINAIVLANVKPIWLVGKSLRTKDAKSLYDMFAGLTYDFPRFVFCIYSCSSVQRYRVL